MGVEGRRAGGRRDDLVLSKGRAGGRRGRLGRGGVEETVSEGLVVVGRLVVVLVVVVMVVVGGSAGRGR